MSWIAEYDTQGREFPTCVHVTKTTHTMTHGATYVPIEDGRAVRTENDELRKERDFYCNQVIENGGRAQRVIDALNDENAKLRELVVEVFGCARRGESCETCKVNNDGYACVYIMRELGMEVD